jgi:hypothetical protein
MNGHREPESKQMGRTIVAAGGKLVRKSKHGVIYQLQNGEDIMIPGRLDSPRMLRGIRSRLRKKGIAI